MSDTNYFLNPGAEVRKIATAGSVDDGKSTLIGRLLFDTGSLPADKIESIRENSRKMGIDYIDYSLATDGLTAEREQGITIDVAHVYFSMNGKRYIIADSPGHVEYTRNMITAASTAELSIILVDARKGVSEQTERHFFINRFMRVKNIVIAINKMDLVDYDESRFNKICASFEKLTDKENIQNIVFIPISALKGDNITRTSEKMPWYRGPALFEILESAEILKINDQAPFRLPIQNVIRPKKSEFHDFRGFAGKIYGSGLKKGDEVTVLPSLNKSKIKGIYFNENEYKEAPPNSSVTVTLEDEVNLVRGDMIVKSGEMPKIAQQITVDICRMSGGEALRVGEKCLLQHTTRRVLAKIDRIENTEEGFFGMEKENHLYLNEIGKVSITLQQPIFCDSYEQNKNTGSLILIDPRNFSTAGVGVIR